MIEVTCDQTGDRAEALDAESALVAASTLCRDAHDACGGLNRPKYTVTFRGPKGLIAASVPERETWLRYGRLYLASQTR